MTDDRWVDYQRVIPRDLFNEAKLLKCLGRLSLLSHDGRVRLYVADSSGDGFRVRQRESDGALCCVSLQFFAPTPGPKRSLIHLYTAYNSRRAWPLQFDLGDVTGLVFDQDESHSYLPPLSEEFLSAIGQKMDGDTWESSIDAD